MTSGERTRAPGAARGSGQIEVTASTKCAAPGCGLALGEHRDADGKQERCFHVDGKPVGSAACAKALAEPPCGICGRRGKHTCTQAARAYLTCLSVQIQMPAKREVSR
ncbi:hypothetical protein [Micromonospora sp. NPDC047730]|uniref:hypothetical protein n=1 Tax=Micromonospora sp. NPDC047730 TaxID=3364253 RepID=UPI0037195FD3